MIKKYKQPETSEVWFRKYLFNDPMFRDIADKLWARIDKIEGEKKNVPPTIEYEKEYLDNTSIALVKKTASRLKLSRDDIYQYYFYKDSRLITFRAPTVVRNGDFVQINIYPETRMKDVENLWPFVEEVKKSFKNRKRKQKNPENKLLIYSIYRSKVANKSMKEIFELYSNGELPYYKGSTSQFHTYKSLKDYYDKYRYRAGT